MTRSVEMAAWLLCILGAATTAYGSNDQQPPGREYHVSPRGNDTNDGSADKMLKTISAAALLAQPGDVVTVHEGVYRERINPPRGGQSDSKRIVYRAASGEHVEIKGSEVVKEWQKVQGDTWKVTLPNAFFGKFNPYDDLIRGDWFDPKGRQHHTGAVYLNGDWLTEAATREDVLNPAGKAPLWFGQVDKDSTTIWAQFPAIDPNRQQVEVNVRRTVFYPEKPGINYITVRGFIMRHAATPWAPPTAEQVGLIGTHWSKGWIIENNVISHSKCSGIALGKYGDCWDNTSANTAEGYIKTIETALKNGWNKESVGHHLVRNNTISHCEQTGIVGSLGAVFSAISGNTIHDIHVQRLFAGAEMAGIKLHGAIDVQISGNHIYRTGRGLWLDWMAQGTRVSRNLFHDNTLQDLFVEVDHGPFLIDDNIFLSPMAFYVVSQGGAYVHNLIAGGTQLNPDGRLTPLLKSHSTELVGLHDNPCGDDRFYNNVLISRGNLTPYDAATLPVWMAGNVFLHGAKPSRHEKTPILRPDFDPAVKLTQQADDWFLEIRLDKDWAAVQNRSLITTDLLGKAAIPNLPYEHPDGSPLRVDTDYFGRARAKTSPFPGPFELPEAAEERLKVWPIDAP
jgi:alpha-N-arabinofuranosidase